MASTLSPHSGNQSAQPGAASDLIAQSLNHSITPSTQHLIVGAGAAGLSLAWRLTRHPATAGQPIVLLDPDPKVADDRTWSFWERADQPGTFPELVSAEWATAEVRATGEQQRLPLGPYRYRTIRGAAFYEAMRAHLATCPHVHWEQAAVARVEDGADGATAHTTDGRAFRGQWLYDSRFRYTDLARQPDRYYYLAQHFVGWEIETAADCFDPAVATLFDFRTPQRGQMRFVYVLPWSARRALVELTLFTADLLTPAEYDAELHRYIREELGLAPGQWRLVSREAGVIPMTNHPLPVRGGQRLVNIGSRGGASKPSTGFTFRRIQAQTAAIVEALARTGQPWPAESAGQQRFWLYDTLLLDVLARRGHRAEETFRQLFRRNPTARLLRFLDEETTFPEEVAVMNSVPLAPFLRALVSQARRALTRGRLS